jgi:L-amino acid N-acyltransferase YncA
MTQAVRLHSRCAGARIFRMSTPEKRPRLTVRQAQETDAPTLREIFNEAVEDGLATFDIQPRSLQEQKQLISAAMQDLRHPMFVGEVRNWACGMAAIEPYDDRRRLDDMGEVVVFVRRSFRSYGVGRQLMRVAQAEAARLGYRKLIGHLLADNHDSLRLCQATGWRVVGEHEQHARHGNRLRNVIVVEYVVPSVSKAQ